MAGPNAWRWLKRPKFCELVSELPCRSRLPAKPQNAQQRTTKCSPLSAVICRNLPNANFHKVLNWCRLRQIEENRGSSDPASSPVRVAILHRHAWRFFLCPAVGTIIEGSIGYDHEVVQKMVSRANAPADPERRIILYRSLPVSTPAPLTSGHVHVNCPANGGHLAFSNRKNCDAHASFRP